MNRREFCLTFGAIAFGGAVGEYAFSEKSAISATEKSDAFSATIIFPEQWRDRFEIRYENTWFRNHLAALARQYDALLVNDQHRTSPHFAAVLEMEANWAGLELYYAVPFSPAISETAAIRSLTIERQKIRLSQFPEESCDGFHFSAPLPGIVLYDASRRSWRTFLAGNPAEQPSETATPHDLRKRNLEMAQWIDTVQKRFV